MVYFCTCPLNRSPYIVLTVVKKYFKKITLYLSMTFAPSLHHLTANIGKASPAAQREEKPTVERGLTGSSDGGGGGGGEPDPTTVTHNLITIINL
jgi:hypothetical protein